MVLVKVAVLLVRFGSPVVELTVAVFSAREGVTAVVTMVMISVSPLIMVPSRQVTIPDAWVQVPKVEVEET